MTRERDFATVAIAHYRLLVLAGNLAWAASLCASFRLGAWHGGEDVYLIGDEEPQTWFPGCRRSAP